MNEEKRVCIIHYDGREKYSNMKDISENNIERIRYAKDLRERVKGENHHVEQCNMIPDAIDMNIHGIHITPCYNKFTLILSQKKEISTEHERRVSKRLSLDSSLLHLKLPGFIRRNVIFAKSSKFSTKVYRFSLKK